MRRAPLATFAQCQPVFVYQERAANLLSAQVTEVRSFSACAILVDLVAVLGHKTNRCGHLSCKRDGEEAPCSSLVAVAISALKRSTIACGHALDRSRSRCNVEEATSSHCHPPEVAAALRPRCDMGSHDVSRLEALHTTASLGAGTWEASLVHQHHLAALASLGSDE